MKKLAIILTFTAAFAFAQQQPQTIVPQTSEPPPAAHSATPQTDSGMPSARPAKPSPEQIEQMKKQQLEAKKTALQREFFGEMRPDTPKLGEPFWSVYKYHIFAAAALAAVVLWLLLRKRKTVPPTPYEMAKADFEKIDDALFEKFGAKEYARRTSQVVRDYIDRIYAIPAPERTTEEFLALAAESGHFDDSAKGELQSILELADKAKFARHAFDKSERVQILSLSEKFVEDDNLKHTPQNGKDSKK